MAEHDACVVWSVSRHGENGFAVFDPSGAERARFPDAMTMAGHFAVAQRRIDELWQTNAGLLAALKLAWGWIRLHKDRVHPEDLDNLRVIPDAIAKAKRSNHALAEDV
jgi:hypothetical protein